MKINLATPFESHGKKYAEIELKEPWGSLYVKLGDPRILVFNPSGSAYWIEQPATIEAYFENLIDHELGSMVLAQLKLDDTMALKEALFSFFTDATERRVARKSTP